MSADTRAKFRRRGACWGVRWRGASIEVRRKRLSIYGPVTVMHAAKGGGPVLRGEASWRTASGVLLGSRRLGWAVTIMARRDRLG